MSADTRLHVAVNIVASLQYDEWIPSEVSSQIIRIVKFEHLYASCWYQTYEYKDNIKLHILAL